MQNLPQIVTKIENQITPKELAVWYDIFIGANIENDDELIPFGEMLPLDDKDFIVYTMDAWVNKLDTFIEQIRAKEEDPFVHALAFSQRGFTYEEFKYVMSGKRPKDYKTYKIFHYLHIINEESHDYFIATNKDEEKTDLEVYLERIKKFAQFEIPSLQAFFFSYRKKYFPLSALRKHAYILGGTGSGKSEVIKYLHYNLWQDSKPDKKTLISLEPHGKLSHELLQFNLIEQDPERVIYLDVFLRETAKKLCGEDVLKENYTFIFNPFDSNKNPNDINYMTQELSSAFFEILDSDATNQMKAVVRACVGTLLYNDNMSVVDLKRFMNDEDNEDLLNLGLRNPNIEHKNLMKTFRNSNLAPTKSGIFYRLQNLIDDIHLRRVLMGKSTIDIEKEMNNGKVIICNLAKGKMGKESAPMLGKLIVALIQGYTLKREALQEHQIKSTFLFIDEAQNYITPSVKQIMTESRKYGLHLILANQILGQDMSSKMRRIILSNTALKFCGDNDPESLKGMGEVMNGLKLKDFDKLKKFHFYAYNKTNKKQGAKMMKVPPNLVKIKPPYYATKEALKKYFLWLANDSGYYVKTSVLKKTQEQQANLKPEGRTKKGGGGVYKNDFID